MQELISCLAVERLAAHLLAGRTLLATLLVAGVPLIVYVKLPVPFANVPAAKVAVKPVTPIEAIVCAAYVPPLPPV